MKKSFFFIVLTLCVTQLWSQDDIVGTTNDRYFRMPLIGETAPSFNAETTNGILNFPGDFGRNWKILISHPQDFTPVCSSEILELAYMQDEFENWE
ncbi:MAG: redoxin domain-containing protein [Bacteroidales bacterium]|nr:redoxin domain-containing protein [Bacteroidales bacterium]